MTLARLQDTRSIHKNQLYAYILAIYNPKIKKAIPFKKPPRE